MDATQDTLLKNIKRYREQQDLTQAELSKKCDYSYTYMGKIERGEVSPSFETLRRLSDVFDITIPELFSPHEITDASDAKLYRQIFRKASAPSGILNRDGQIIEINDAFKQTFEVEDEELLQNPIWELSYWLNIETAEEKFRKSLEKAQENEPFVETFSFEESSHPIRLIINRLDVNGTFHYLFEYHSPELFEKYDSSDYELSEIRTEES